jgi:hypothetical protein
LFAGISPEVQKAIDIMSEDELVQLISFYEQTKMPVGGIIGFEDLPADINQEFRWRFKLGKPLVKLELVNKLPTKMRRFHDWYLKKSAEGLEMFGMLVRPGDFALQNEKVVWLRFTDIYEIYHLDAMNTDLMMAWSLEVTYFHMFINNFITFVDLLINIWLSSCVACNLLRWEGRVIQEFLSWTHQKLTRMRSRTNKKQQLRHF